MGTEICAKMLLNLREKLGAEFSAIAVEYFTLRVAHFDGAYSGISELEASPV